MDFIVIGAMKAATSTVCAYFEDHPEVYMVPGGEPNYFSRDENYAKGLDWYHAHLAPRTTERLCAEGSNHYSARALHPHSAERMAAYNPDMKIVYMLRHPLDRIVSAWIQNRANKGDAVPPTLDRAVREMPDTFIGQSRYWYNLAPYREHFGDDRIFLGFMEDLNRDETGFLAELTGFLGVAPHEVQRGHLNKSMGKRVPTRAYTALNQAPFARTFKALLPGGLRRQVKQRLLSRPVAQKPEFSSAVRAELVEVLKPEAEAVLRHCGKPADFWRFD
jgi:hypothetical protein